MATPQTAIILTADDRTKQAFDSLRRNMGALRSESGALGAAMSSLIPAVSVAALASFAKSGIDAADSLKDMSTRVGVSVKDLAGVKLIAEQSGTSLEGLAKSMQKLSLSVGQAQSGNKEVARSLKDLGITATDPIERLAQLADAYQKTGGATRTLADLQKVLGKNYAEIIPTLAEGSDAIRKSARESESFANAMARLAPNADKFNDSLALMKTNLAGFSASILADAVPALNTLMERFNNIKSAMSAGGFFAGISLSGTLSEDIPKINAEVKSLETTLARVKQNPNSLDNLFINEDKLNRELANLKKVQAALREQSFNGAMEIANQQYKKIPIQSAGSLDFPKDKVKAGKPIDLAGMQAEDLANAWKMADAELKKYLDDAQFMNEVDIAQKNPVADIAEQWKEAGRALTNEMMTPLEKFNGRLEYLNELIAHGVINTETLDRATADAFDRNMPALEKTKSIAEEIGLTFTSAFEDAIVGGKKFQDVLKGLGDDILRLLVRKTATEPLTAFISGLFKANADGNVFSGAGISAYSGSVVSRPTLFPFAKGIGLMGENGSEAILPLKRGADGKLGVAGGGAGGVVINIVESPGNGGKTAERKGDNGSRIIDIMVERVKAAVAADISSGGGPVSGAMERTFGLNRTAGAY